MAHTRVPPTSHRWPQIGVLEWSVVPKANGGVHICVDLTKLNECLPTNSTSRWTAIKRCPNYTAHFSPLGLKKLAVSLYRGDLGIQANDTGFQNTVHTRTARVPGKCQ